MATSHTLAAEWPHEVQLQDCRSGVPMVADGRYWHPEQIGPSIFRSVLPFQASSGRIEAGVYERAPLDLSLGRPEIIGRGSNYFLRQFRKPGQVMEPEASAESEFVEVREGK